MPHTHKVRRHILRDEEGKITSYATTMETLESDNQCAEVQCPECHTPVGASELFSHIELATGTKQSRIFNCPCGGAVLCGPATPLVTKE